MRLLQVPGAREQGEPHSMTRGPAFPAPLATVVQPGLSYEQGSSASSLPDSRGPVP